MSETPYTFCVLRYAHDPIAGELLNVGVLLHSPGASFLETIVEPHYERLSRTFSGFDGERYRDVVNDFQNQIEKTKGVMSGAGELFVVADSTASDAGAIGRKVWADQGFSFRISETMGGLATGSLDTELRDLFHRFVTSQFDKAASERIDEDQIWARTRPLLSPAVSRVLHPKAFATSDINVTFDHAFENERWHLVQPVSFDLKQAASIQRKAATWLGLTVPLEENEEARDASIYFVLQPPTDKKKRPAYNKAKNLLDRTPIRHEFYEPHELDDLAAELESHVDRS